MCLYVFTFHAGQYFFVEEIQPWPAGEYVLTIKGGQELTVTRMYKNNLKSIAQLWVGTDAFS